MQVSPQQQQILQQLFGQYLKQAQQQAQPAAPAAEMPWFATPEARKGLATAGRTMATTPGNFLTGLTSGITSGVDAYHGAKPTDKQKLAEKNSADDRRRRIIREALATGKGVQAKSGKPARTTDHLRFRDQHLKIKELRQKVMDNTRKSYEDTSWPEGLSIPNEGESEKEFRARRTRHLQQLGDQAEAEFRKGLPSPGPKLEGVQGSPITTRGVKTQTIPITPPTSGPRPASGQPRMGRQGQVYRGPDGKSYTFDEQGKMVPLPGR